MQLQSERTVHLNLEVSPISVARGSSQSSQTDARTCSQCPAIQCKPKPSSSGGGINPGVIAGPVVAVLVIASLALFWYLRKKKVCRAHQASLALGLIIRDATCNDSKISLSAHVKPSRLDFTYPTPPRRSRRLLTLRQCDRTAPHSCRNRLHPRAAILLPSRLRLSTRNTTTRTVRRLECTAGTARSTSIRRAVIRLQMARVFPLPVPATNRPISFLSSISHQSLKKECPRRPGGSTRRGRTCSNRDTYPLDLLVLPTSTCASIPPPTTLDRRERATLRQERFVNRSCRRTLARRVSSLAIPTMCTTTHQRSSLRNKYTLAVCSRLKSCNLVERANRHRLKTSCTRSISDSAVRPHSGHDHSHRPARGIVGTRWRDSRWSLLQQQGQETCGSQWAVWRTAIAFPRWAQADTSLDLTRPLSPLHAPATDHEKACSLQSRMPTPSFLASR